MRIISIALFILATAGHAFAQDIRHLAPGAASPPATIDSLRWLEGRWIGEGLGMTAEEIVSPAIGGSMIGVFRASRDGAPAFYELISYREENGSLMLRLKHFNPDLKGWEEKAVTVDFPLVAVEGDRVYFDGLTIERVGDRRMRQYVELAGGSGGRQTAVFEYRRPD